MTGFEFLTPSAPVWLLAVMALAGLTLVIALIYCFGHIGSFATQEVGIVLGLLAAGGTVGLLWNGLQGQLTDALHAEVNAHYNVTIDHAEDASATTQIVNLTDSDGTQHLATLQIKDGRATLYTSPSEEWPT